MSKEINSTNPVTRLLKILQLAKSRYQHGGITTNRDLWSAIFEIENPKSEEGFLEVLSRMGELKILFRDAIKALEEIENVDDQLFIAPIRQMAKIDLNAVYSVAESYINLLTDTNLLALKFAQNLISTHPASHEKEIPKDEIQSLLDEVRKVYDSIVNSKLSKQFKADILDALKEIEQSIHEYQINGIIRIRQGLVRSAGAVTTNSEEIQQNQDLDEIQSLAKMLTRLEKLINFANKAYPLLLQAGNILPAIGTHLK